METIDYFPPRDMTRVDFDAPVVQVTLLEDRASVMRRGTIRLEPGQNRLHIANVAPVLQDVSVRGRSTSESAQVSDAMVRRAIRVRRAHKPDDVRELEDALRAALLQFQDMTEARERHEARWLQVQHMLTQGIVELPEDAAWGVLDTEQWQETFSGLFERSRSLFQKASETYFEQLDLHKEIGSLAFRRAHIERPDQHFAAWLELDVVVEAAGEVTIEVEYVVPNALWRPLHRARLEDESKMRFTSRAAVWQNTGEDWNDVDLVFSTARSSLGTEPPLLVDDLLKAQRKSEELVLEARQVAVQSASVSDGGGGTASKPSTVDLPGVDDGGNVQNLRPEGKYTMPSTGEPHFVDLFTFDGEANVSRVLMAEVVPRVLLKSVQSNGHTAPILAGPVELMQNSGAVGWTQTLFVAPGERFELGYGPQDDIRVHRDERTVEVKVDEVDKWTRRTTEVRVFLSNLNDQTQVIEITERIPVSEIEHVVISIEESHTTPHLSLDENGFGTWTGPLDSHERSEVRLRWTMATAPGVKGL